MNETGNRDRCLCCGKTLDGKNTQTQWHTACTRRFFGTASFPSLDVSTRTLEQLASISVNAGTTVTGAQKKMSLHLENFEGRKRLTLVGYPSGFILKPPAADYPELPELEHAVMQLATKAGIRTVPHGLIRLPSGELAYITRRIDRIFGLKGKEKIGKIPMEDFCQLSGRLTEDKYKGSYEQCGKVINRHSSRSGLDAADFFSLVLFSFVTGNADMHLKNFSLLESTAGYILSPAYDLVPTKLLLKEDKEETALTLNGKKSRLDGNDFVRLGNSLGLLPKVTGNLVERAANLSGVLLRELPSCFLSAGRIMDLSELIEERCARLALRTLR